MFKPGQKLIVLDSECRINRQEVTYLGPTVNNTAESGIQDANGYVWIIHNCRLRTPEEMPPGGGHLVNTIDGWQWENGNGELSSLKIGE